MIQSLFSSEGPSRQPMCEDKLDELIRQITSDVVGQIGNWQFLIKRRDILVITSVEHNRMRIMSRVTSQDQLSADELARLLEANYASALDAKYALRDQTLWAVFTHPLAELTEEQFLDCVAQVANLANNFGRSYASGNLSFD